MSDEFRAHPEAVMERLREADPVHHDQVLGRYVVTQHEDVTAVLQDRALSVDPAKAPEGSIFGNFAAPSDSEFGPNMLFMDPPDHDRLRALVSKAFTPKAVESMRPRVVEIANRLLDAVGEKDSFDLIADFAAPLPTIVIAEMLGVDPADQGKFKEWSDISVQSFNPVKDDELIAAIDAANRALMEYLREAVERRKSGERSDDLMTALVDVEEAGDQLSVEEMVMLCALLLEAGNLTTTDLIGNGAYALLSNPAQFDRLRADPSMIVNAVEEMIRFDPPVTDSARLALEDTEVGGCPIPAGELITTSLTGANHDPAVHPNPHDFDIEREHIDHRSFGGGRRYCLGAPLARLETQVAITTLLERFPNLTLAPGTDVEHRQLFFFRGLVELQVST